MRMIFHVVLVFLMGLTTAGFSQTPGENEVFERCISLKLPLDQPRFHWYFTDEDLFLKGELSLKIEFKRGTVEHLIFKGGGISDAWIPMRDEDRGIYFMFRSRDAYRISREDRVLIRLEVVEDLKGIGAEFEGVLKAGVYESKGHFSIYEKDPEDENKFAHLSSIFSNEVVRSNWDPLWQLEITSETGWMENVYDEAKQALSAGAQNYSITIFYDEDGTRAVRVFDHLAKEHFGESFRNQRDLMSYLNQNRDQLPENVFCVGFGEGFIAFCKELQKNLTPITVSYLDIEAKKEVGKSIRKFNTEMIRYFEAYKSRP